MAETEIFIRNHNQTAIFVQVDPWAGYYQVAPGDSLHLVAEHPDVGGGSFDIIEDGNVRYLTLLFCSGYFVVVDGRRIYFDKFPTNMGA